MTSRLWEETPCKHGKLEAHWFDDYSTSSTRVWCLGGSRVEWVDGEPDYEEAGRALRLWCEMEFEAIKAGAPEPPLDSYRFVVENTLAAALAGLRVVKEKGGST